MYHPRHLSERHTRRVEAMIENDTPAPAEEVIEAVEHLLIKVDSSNRLSELLRFSITERRPEVLWPVFLRWWSSCDATWEWRHLVVSYLENLMGDNDGTDHPATPWMSEGDLEFYRSLPDEITLYRGCSRKHVKGLAWSTDRAAAETFAHGHRGFTVSDPVVAETIFPKEKVFAVFTSRNENEVVIDYAALGKIKRHKYTPPPAPPKKDGPSLEELIKEWGLKPVSAEELEKLRRKDD